MAAKTRDHFFSCACSPGTMKRPDLVEPVGAGDHDGRHAAQLELEQQRAGGALDVRRRLDLLAERVAGVVVGREHQLEQLRRRRTATTTEDDDQEERRPDQPGPQLAEVVGEGHPPVRADRVCRSSPEQVEQTAIVTDVAACAVVRRSCRRGARRGDALALGPAGLDLRGPRAPAARPSWSALSSSSPSMRPLVSALKMRSARPLPRASSGSLAGAEEQDQDGQDDQQLGRAEACDERVMGVLTVAEIGAGFSLRRCRAGTA